MNTELYAPTSRTMIITPYTGISQGFVFTKSSSNIYTSVAIRKFKLPELPGWPGHSDQVSGEKWRVAWTCPTIDESIADTMFGPKAPSIIGFPWLRMRSMISGG
jgi:hypothetical protein